MYLIWREKISLEFNLTKHVVITKVSFSVMITKTEPDMMEEFLLLTKDVLPNFVSNL